MSLHEDEEWDSAPLSSDSDLGTRPKATPSWRIAAATAAVLGFASIGAVAWSRSRGTQEASVKPAATQEGVALTEVFLPAGTRSSLANLNVNFMPYGEVQTDKLSAPMQAELSAAVGWPPATLRNRGANCWLACGQQAGDCKWCGLGNACCRDGSPTDPPECRGAYFPVTGFHTCVKPALPVAVKHAGQDCWNSCGKKSGYCTWCGAGNACCRAGFDGVDAAECRGTTSFPVKDRYTCVATLGNCPLGKTSDGKGGCRKPEKPQLMTFYMYRSTNDENYGITNGVNMASLGGALWYLHNEVVISCPRKFKITRIRRFKVTMKASHKLYSTLKNNFDLFVAYDKGQCTVPNCKETHWDKYGYVVGCIKNDLNVANYKDPVWYSLPGDCPSYDYTQKNEECKRVEPGGMCPYPNGESDCTWWAEDAGEVRLNELEGILDYDAFCAGRNVEYDPQTDKGVGNNFWDGKLDAGKCQARMTRVKDLFAEKYPGLPRDFGEPECDGWR